MNIAGHEAIYNAIHDGNDGKNAVFFDGNDYPVFVYPPIAEDYYEGHDGLKEGDDVRFVTVSTDASVTPELILNSLCQKGLIHNAISPAQESGLPSLSPISIYMTTDVGHYEYVHIVFEDKSVSL